MKLTLPPKLVGKLDLGLRKKEDRMKLNLPPILVGKLVWVPVISFCKSFIPSYAFDALLCRNWPFSPPNRLTLLITLMVGKL
jgi:hypothetical protein